MEAGNPQNTMARFRKHLVTPMKAAAALLYAGVAMGAASAPSTGPSKTPATQPAPDVAIADADAGKTVHLAVGQAAIISLLGNPTTGYRWSVTATDGAALEQKGDIEYVADTVPPRVVGSGGKFVATFRAVKAGTTKITLGYARPFERGVPPVRTFDVTIVVDARQGEKPPASAPASHPN